MTYDEDEQIIDFNEPGSGLYMYCAMCDKDITLSSTHDTDLGIVCSTCYEDLP